jgi:hypothetical protein
MMLKKLFLSFILLLMAFSSIAMERSDAHHEAEVFIVSPKNNETVSNPIKVVFGIKNMIVLPAGVKEKFSGHHHLLVDVDNLPDVALPIPSDENHIHFGKAQTESVLNLPPGQHTLQLLLGDHYHVPHNPAVVSEIINIIVK